MTQTYVIVLFALNQNQPATPIFNRPKNQLDSVLHSSMIEIQSGPRKVWLQNPNPTNTNTNKVGIHYSISRAINIPFHSIVGSDPSTHCNQVINGSWCICSRGHLEISIQLPNFIIVFISFKLSPSSIKFYVKRL